MCGLVAILSKQAIGFTYKDKTIFLQMLISDMFRGMDSTGSFAVNKYGNLKLVKDASPAPFFINKKEANKYFNDFVSDYHIVVGHNRKATIGNIESTTAHPFIEGNICLVHNGTLQNHYKLAQRVVDSNAIAAHINEHGYKSLLKNIEGAYALIWYNAEEKTLYFTRNAERPLHLVETNERIYIASEPKMLDWILDRNDLSKYTIQNVPTDKVFKFNLETRKLEAESKPKKAEPVKNKPTYSYQSTTSQVKQMSSGFGNLALIHSSESKYKANIETYTSGQQVSWKLITYDPRAGSTRFQGETTDGYRTPVNIFLDHNKYTEDEINAFTDAEWLTGTIMTISSKHGVVQLWLKTCAIETTWKSANKKNITKDMLETAGGACYSCGEVINTKEQVEKSVISLNSHGEILFITCNACCMGTSTHYGHC